MTLACVSVPGRGGSDRFLADIATMLAARGLRLAGAVQTNPERVGRRECDMDLRVLPDGPTFRISEDRGDLARGCRLDSGALEMAVEQVMRRIAGVDLLLVNKFGKREAEGRGMIPAIAEVVAAGRPVLLGVNALNLPALRTFAEGFLAELPADPVVVVDWCLAHVPADAA